jgi:putative oxidoreductase
VRTRLRSIDAGQIAVVCGLIFIPAGLVKFAFYHWELHAFRDFGIPAATVLEPLVGALETLGGVFLALRLLVVPTAFVLAVIMLVAFISGGIIHGDAIPSDTLAPALLAAMIYLVWKGLTAPSSRP